MGNRRNEKGIRAVCTWGDGPDVLLVLEGKKLICYHNPKDEIHWIHGIISEGSMDLTAHEALELAAELIRAAEDAIKLDESVRLLEVEDTRRNLRSVQESASRGKKPTV